MIVQFRLAALAIAVGVLLAVPSVAAADEYIVVLKDEANEPAEAAATSAKPGADVGQHYDDALNGFSAELSAAALNSVRSDPQVDFVAKSRSFYIPRDPRPPRDQNSLSDYVQSFACGPGAVGPLDSISRIGAPFSSAMSSNCRDSVPPVGVAVIDTGVDNRHADLPLTGAASCVPGLPAFEDVDGHGTFIGGVIAAADNQFGPTGVAPGANLISIRVTPNRATAIPTSALVCALDAAIATRQDAEPRNDVHVANMSLSGAGRDDGRCGKLNNDPIHMAVCRATKAGITVVAAAGNVENNVADRIPASYDEVVTVAGMGDFDGRPGGQDTPTCVYNGVEYDDSQYGQVDDGYTFYSGYATLAEDRAHTVAAPAQCVTSTAPVAFCWDAEVPPDAECYDTGEGTSYAVPHVSGVVALCIAYRHCKRLSAKEIRLKIVRDASRYNLANPGYGYVGDPLRPVGGRHYGWLIRAGIY